MQNNYRVKKNIERLISKIRNHDQLISPDVEFAYQFEAQILCNIIESLERQIKRIEKEMLLILNSHHLGKYFLSLPGTGKVLSSKLLSTFGDQKI